MLPAPIPWEQLGGTGPEPARNGRLRMAQPGTHRYAGISLHPLRHRPAGQSEQPQQGLLRIRRGGTGSAGCGCETGQTASDPAGKEPGQVIRLSGRRETTSSTARCIRRPKSPAGRSVGSVRYAADGFPLSTRTSACTGMTTVGHLILAEGGCLRYCPRKLPSPPRLNSVPSVSRQPSAAGSIREDPNKWPML
ncbi:MAG: hypothetical protein RLY31_628 [Bacteroidota bacterium]